MQPLGHIRLRRRETVGRRIQRLGEKTFVRVVAAAFVLRGLWRHRPPLLHR